MVQLRFLSHLTLPELQRIVRRRLPVLKDGPAWTVGELAAFARQIPGIRFAELLLRQEAIIRRTMPWEPLSFDGKRVVEIGCGPLAGFGPLVVFCGAISFESAEPEWSPELFEHEAISTHYLRVLHADLVALYGSRMDFAQFIRALKERITIHRTGFEAAPIEGSVDVVLSQSCLEHVFPLDAVIARLAEIQNPATRFVHLVDFGNHYPTASPFEELYEEPSENYIARRGPAINLKRAPDLCSAFQAHGIAAVYIPSRINDDYAGTIHPWWSQRYDHGGLFTHLALFAGPGTQ
jgi:SAM-dependent methyltransferase